jgi:general secretion pathway protein D
MKKYYIIQRIIAVVLMVALFAPVALAGGGGKPFKKGRKFEAAQQWDLAAEQYALALSEDPSNPEYKLHFLRALTNASLSLAERGKVLAEQGDYEGAYQAFRQAYSYDNTNEMALSRMKSMLEKLGVGNTDSLPNNPNDLRKTSLSSNSASTKDVALSTPKFRKQNFEFSTEASVMAIINSIASQCGKGLNIVYEDNIAKLVETKKTRFVLKDVTAPKALDILLSTQRLSYAQLDRRTVLVFADALANRQKYEELYVRTFYIKNSVLDDAATVLQQAMGSKQIVKIKNLNALVIRDTKENLALIETILEKVDKAQSEVVLDVNLYEVNDRNMLQIGNQFDAGILGGLGNFAGDGSLRRSSLPGVFGGLNTGIVAPSSTFSFLQSKNIGKLIASTQIRAFENEAGSVNIGSRVPIRTATIPTGNVVTTGLGQNGQPSQTSQSVLGGIGGVEQIQYENVGLNIELTPQVLNEYVQMKLAIESSSVVQEAQGSRRTQSNPTFNQRKVKGVARIKEGETGIVASVMRIDKSEGATGIPILSFLPIAGRFFATPKNDSMATNIVITITPHVLRAPYVGESDLKAIGPNGTASVFGATPSLEEIITRADYEDDLEKLNQSTGTPQVGVGQTNQPNQNTPSITPTKNQIINNNVNQPIGNPPKPNNSPAPVPEPNKVPPSPFPVPNPPPAPPTESSSINPSIDDTPITESVTQANTSPITVLARVLNPQISLNQVGLVGIVFSSNNIPVSEASVSLRFNPSVIKVKSVQDGGLMSLSGPRAEFNYNEFGDVVNINIRRPSNSSPVSASGQFALVYFEGVGQGSGDLNISEAQLLGPDSQSLPITLVNSNMEVQKVQNNGNNGNGGNEDDEDDEDDE